MGNFVPIFLALILNVIGFNIFLDPKTQGCEPLISCLIFLYAIFLLLLEMKLSVSGLRGVCKCGSYFLQFCFAAFIFDYALNFFWFPIEATSITVLTKVVEVEDDALIYINWKKKDGQNFLKSATIQVIASYMLSIFFLAMVLHATSYIDLRLLKKGPRVFFGDVLCRLKKYKNKMKQSLFPQQNVTAPPEEYCSCSSRNPKNDSKEIYSDLYRGRKSKRNY